MKRILVGLFAISLLGIGGSALADDGSGFVSGDGRSAEAQVVSVSVPPSAFRGDVVTVSVSYPSVNPTNLRCFLLLPVNDPIYEQELKVYVRKADLATEGATCPFYIPDFNQIEGTAIAYVVVDGEGSDAATFEIFP